MATVSVLVLVAVAGWFGPGHTMLVAGAVGAVLMLLLARVAGLNAEDVGLGRRFWRRGAVYAGICVVSVAAVYAVAAALPATRPAFLDERYRTGLGTAVHTAFWPCACGNFLPAKDAKLRSETPGLVSKKEGKPWPACRARRICVRDTVAECRDR